MIKVSLPSRETRRITALALHSAALIAYQLILMQLLARMQGYHFAYMIISIAMLGFGASGTLLAIFKKPLLRNAPWLVPSLMSLSGLMMIVAIHLAGIDIFQFDIYLLFADRSQFAILASNYIIYFLPFFVGALAIGIIFVQKSSFISKYYFSNLLGSGAGGVLVVVLLSNLLPLHSLVFASALSLIAGLLLFATKKKIYQISALIAGAGVLVSFLMYPADLPLSQYKSLSQTLNLPEAEIIYDTPDVHGQIEIVRSPALRYAPAISFSFTGKVPAKDNIFLNAEFYGVIPDFDTTRTNIHDYTTEALPYIMQPRNNVVVLRETGGSGVAHAIQNNADNVLGILEVKGVKNILAGNKPESDNTLFHHPAATFIYQDSRQFLETEAHQRYDAVILPRMESFGGSVGLNALQENYLLTQQSFNRMWNKLSPNGVIAISSWIDYPSRTTLKIAATLVAVLKDNGIKQPDKHIAAIKSWGTITFIIKKTPISEAEQESIRNFCHSRQFDIVLLPDLQQKERRLYNMLEDESLFDYLDLIVHGDSQGILEDYDFYIEPATDDKPYFSRFLKASRIKDLGDTFGAETMPFLELGYLIVWITLLQSALLAFILIILPLFRLNRKGQGKTTTLLYFGALGLGYMFAEIIFIQRFILYFGHPVYAISAVISTMMIASGAGSLFSGYIKNPLWASRIATLGIAAILILYALIFTPLLTFTIGLAMGSKIIIAFILLAIPSFLMGIPFPSGIRILGKTRSDEIPWAWGINGCLSVIATALATLIAVENGFRAVILAATFCYIVAFAVFARK